MPKKLVKVLSDADEVIIPFETIAAGNHVSSVIIRRDDLLHPYALFEDDSTGLGPIDVRETLISSDDVKSWILERQNRSVRIAANTISIELSRIQTPLKEVWVITRLVFKDESNEIVLVRDGADYPYSMLLLRV